MTDGTVHVGLLGNSMGAYRISPTKSVVGQLIFKNDRLTWGSRLIQYAEQLDSSPALCGATIVLYSERLIPGPKKKKTA